VIVEPTYLKGNFVSLEPLSLEHVPALSEVGFDPSIWKWAPVAILDEQSMESYVRAALGEQIRGSALPFVTREMSSGKIVGSTRFGNIDVQNRRVEIGWTWVAPMWQRTYVNTEAKLLMLTHAFERWECIRVEFKTDALNERSRNAIARLGAKQEGIFRKHMITETGRFRDSVYFSIIDSEWPAIKTKLISMLEK
jgi:RimJ/RimL family protein N-acetyltransferase